MRIHLSFIRCLFPLSFSIALLFLFSGATRGQTSKSETNPNSGVLGYYKFAEPVRAQSTKLEIDYTGSLLGYYRMEFGEPDGESPPPVEAFLDFASLIRADCFWAWATTSAPSSAPRSSSRTTPARDIPTAVICPKTNPTTAKPGRKASTRTTIASPGRPGATTYSIS